MRRTWAWAALLLAICAAFYWKLLFTDQYSFMDSPDLANMELPRLQYLATQINHLRLPLWNPNLWCGQPFLAQFTGAAYPANWILPLGLVKGKLSFAFMHWLFVLIHFQGALFMFWLCRDLGRSAAASLLAGLVFGLAAFLGDTDWPQVLNGAVWAPAVVMFSLRAVRGKRVVRNAALGGLCLGLAWLSGHHEVPIYITFAAAAIWLWGLLRGSLPRGPLVAAAAVMLIIAALVSGLQTLPGVEYGRLAKRWAGWPDPLAWNDVVPYSVHAQYSFNSASLLGMVLAGQYAHVNPFIGVTAFTLAVLGVILWWKDAAEVSLFLLLTVGALAFAMGANNWMHGVLYSIVPLFGKARVPARILAIFNLGIAPLVAYGLDGVLRDGRAGAIRRGAIALLAAGVAGFAGAAAFSLAKNQPASSVLLNSAVAAIALGAVLLAWRAQAFSSRIVAAVALILSLWEIGNVSGSARFQNLRVKGHESPLVRLQENDDVARFLRGQGAWLRVNVNDQEVDANIGDWHGIPMLQGYLAGVTADLLELELHKPRIQDLLAAGFTVSKESNRPGQQDLFQGSSGVHVWRNPDAFPRARIVHEAVPVASPAQRRVLYDDPAFDLRRKTALVGAIPRLEACDDSSEAAAVTEPRPALIEIDTNLSCRGMVILADTWFPGWSASVDGNPARIWQADGALRGVVVEAGRHHIRMQYQPQSFWLGLSMTLLGVACVVALARRG
jgi:hypothetical protein